MVNSMKKIIFSFIILLSVIACHSQSVNKISTPCRTPFTGQVGSIQAAATGDLVYRPCPTRSSLFHGITDFTDATVIGLSSSGFISGTGTANFIPRYTAPTVLGNTPFSWDGILYEWNNTALTGTFKMQFTPSALGVGLLRFGNPSGFGNTYFELDEAGDSASVSAATNAAIIAPSVSVGSASTINVNFAAGSSSVNYNFSKTVTPIGTTGNQTINKPLGSVNFAAGASDIVVTNSTVTVNSLILCTVQTNDDTAVSCRVTDKASGSFHIRIPAATAETQVMFFVG